MDKHIEVLIPTIGERDSIATQVESIKAQYYTDWRVSFLADGFSERVRGKVGQYLDDPRFRVIDIPGGPLGNVGHKAARWTLENINDLHGWFYIIGDDDYTYPNALQDFADAMDNVSMVVAVVKAVERHNPDIFVRWLGDQEIKVCHVTGSGCMFKLEDVKKLEPPFYKDGTYDSDWQLITRMLDRFPYKRISNVVYRLAFS